MKSVLAVVSLVLLAVPAAQAQIPEGEWTVTFAGTIPAELKPDNVTSTTLTLTVTGEGFGCVEEQTLQVALAVSGGISGVILEVPASHNFTIPAGQYALEGWSGEAEIPARLLISRLAAQGTSVNWTVTATAQASGLDCLPDSPDASTTLELSSKIAVVPEPEVAIEHPSHEEHGGFDAYLKAGESFSFTFEEHGVFPYHDHLEPTRVGRVNVVDDESAAISATVRITATGYDPANVTVREGGKVTWNNEDVATRTVSLDELHGVEETDGHDHAHEGDDEKESPGAWPFLPIVGALAIAWIRRRKA